VAARSSAFRFKDRGVDAREAGKELGVSSVLEGSVRRAGNRVRITVQLVEVATGFQSWSERYDGTLEDIFQIQEDTAKAIIEQLQVKFGASGPTRVLREHTTEPEAYEMYLRGRSHLERRHRGEQLQALACFRSAVAIDPDYALAHVGIADVHWTAAAYGGVSEDESRAASRAALDRALELDPELPEAHASKAVLATMECDWDRAEALYERALALDPNYWLTHAYRAMQAGVSLQGAVVDHHVARVLELEPESAFAVGICGLAKYFAEDYEAAIELGHRALEIDPELVMAHMALAWAHSDSGENAAAIVHAEQALQTAQRAPIFVAILASICGLAGDRERSARLLEELHRRAENERVNPLFLGMAYLGTGDRETAHRYYLDAMGSDRPPAWGPCMAGRPFPDILEMLGLPVPERDPQAAS